MWAKMLDSPPASRAATASKTKRPSRGKAGATPKASKPRTRTRSGKGQPARKTTLLATAESTGGTVAPADPSRRPSKASTQFNVVPATASVVSSEAGGPRLGSLMDRGEEKRGLWELDVAWNSMQGPAVVALFAAMQRESKLKVRAPCTRIDRLCS